MGVTVSAEPRAADCNRREAAIEEKKRVIIHLGFIDVMQPQPGPSNRSNCGIADQGTVEICRLQCYIAILT